MSILLSVDTCVVARVINTPPVHTESLRYSVGCANAVCCGCHRNGPESSFTADLFLVLERGISS